MSIYSFGGTIPNGWKDYTAKFGMIGNVSGNYNISDGMYKGSEFSSPWYWTHGNIAGKVIDKNEKITKGVCFLYPTNGPVPIGTRVMAKVGLLGTESMYNTLYSTCGFEKGGTDWGWYWSHPILCMVTSESVFIDGKMVFFSSFDYESTDTDPIGSVRVICNNADVGRRENSFTSGWYYHSFQLVKPPIDDSLVISNCKSNITNANSESCKPIMKKYCSADDIKISGSPICNTWCRMNPAECDIIKIDFCQSHPGDPYCDCINSSTRQSYIDEILLMKPESRALPKVCNTKLCNTRLDLVDVFHPNGYLNDKLTFQCPPLEFIDQSVNVDGANNVVDVKQDTTKNTTVNTQNGSSSGNSSNTNTGGSTGNNNNNNNTPDVPDKTLLEKYWWILVILFIVIFVTMFQDDPIQAVSHHTQHAQQV